MTQMDQVTQSNSAQTEELSATAQSLSEQAAHLLELVGTFTLTRSGRSVRDRQAFQSREASSAYTVGASLLHEAKNSLVHSAAAQQSAQRSAKGGRNSSPAKSSSRARANKAPSDQQAVMATAVAAASGGSDASFEEF